MDVKRNADTLVSTAALPHHISLPSSVMFLTSANAQGQSNVNA
jgi:hypothetical protein